MMRSLGPFLLALAMGFLAGATLRHAHGASGESANPLGQSQPECYLLDRQTAVYRTVASADGNLGAAASDSISDIVLDGRCTLELSPRFTSATGTATLEVCYYNKAAAGTYTTLCTERIDVAAGSTREQAASGRYIPDARVILDSAAANRIEVRVTAWAGGETSMTIWAGTR